uniref:Ribosome biogenesis regulatory protein n=1 Tax=Leptobrachium leishanense TaxID=445787 RepID=A0A8C5PX00_9ANUR
MAAISVEQVLAQAEKDEAEKLRRITVQKELELQYDLGNMLAIDPNALNERDFRQQSREHLHALARDNTQLLVNQLFGLPCERVQEAVVVKLPDCTTRLPREKPVPKPRAPTRWEEFAKLKGIQKKKKTNLVWDEVHKQWRRRWGYQRAKDNTKEWLIELPVTADPAEDQFAKRIHAKKERVAKNELNRLRNIARSSKLGKVPGVGLTPTVQPTKSELGLAMQVARRSTASVGRFQDKLPREKEPRGTGKKRKFQPLIGDFSAEKSKQLEMLKLMDSKKPKLDVTRAVNRQMREEDSEAAAKRRKSQKPGRGGKQGGNRKGGKGAKGGKGGKGRGGKFSGAKRKSK